MKMDCNITDNFFRELDRMCESCARCDQCELKELKGKYQTLECSTLAVEHWEEVINVVQKWSDEHQPETRLEHFKKMFPKAPILGGRPKLCVGSLTGKFSCKGSCLECWNKPYTGGEF